MLAGYFYNGYGWNQTARYDAIWAFVEPGPNRGTVRIDDFLVDPEKGLNTGDWARNPEQGEHYYANKAPGTTLLGIPFYAALYHVETAWELDPTSVSGVLVNAYLIHLWVTVLPVALSSIFFFGILVRLGCTLPTAVAYTGLLYAGTLILPFSTMLWGHATAAAFIVMALACFLDGRPGSWIWSGALAGAAVLTDYGAAPFAVGLVATAVVAPRFRERAGRVVLGGVGPLLVFMVYHVALFGWPLRLASAYSPGDMLTDSYVFGLFGGLRLSALRGLTFSTARGIFVFMPVLLLSVLGAKHIRRHPHEPIGWLALFNVVAALAMNMSFNAWQAGVSSGPRYLITSLPFYVVLLAFLPADRRVRLAVTLLGAVSVANMFVIAAVSPMAPDAFHGSPLFLCWAKLLGVLRIDLGIAAAPPPGGSLSRGSLHIYPLYPMRDWAISLRHPLIERYASFNLGERLLGLRGTASLVPVILVCAGLGGAALRAARRLEADRSSESMEPDARPHAT